MTAITEMAPAPVAAPAAKGEPLARQFKYYSQFIYRYVFALLLFLYIRHQGLAPGFLSEQQINLAMLVYVCAVAVIQFLARGQRLTDPLQRALVGLDLGALMIGVPHDPNPGLPTLFVFYLAYADLGLRYRFQLYVESLFMGIVAVGVMLYLRAYHTALGITPPDAWQVLLLFVIVLHGLQVFSGRDKARRLLQESEQRLQLALDTPGVGAWSTDEPLQRLKIDGHMREVLGMGGEAETELMADYIARIHPEDRERVVEHYTRFIRSGETAYEDQYRVVRRDGEIMTLVSRAQAFRDSSRSAPRIAGMVWDQTEQKKQQEALLRMEERYRLATHSARVGVWIWHIAKDRFEHDDALNQLLGLPAGGRAARLEQVLDMVLEEDRGPFRARIEAALASDVTEYFDEIRVAPREGEVHVIQSRAVIYRDAQGRALRMAGANWDATHLAEARKALEEKTRALEISNRELDDFTYIASHDLKEPLRGLRNYAQFLEQDYGPRFDDEGRRMLAKLGEQSARMEALINELLNIARLGRAEIHLEDTDLDALAREILASLEFMLREKNVQLRLPRPLPTLRCDRVRVGELLRNLITNAVKYNDKPLRWVEITEEQRGGEACFVVRDNGIGIKAEHQAQVFNLFERLHGREAYGGGTGVGLTIVQKIVQLHGGRIWIESEPGQGTAFCFTLRPARPA